MADERLKRFGNEPETAEKLADDASRGEAVLGIHGVSVTARETSAPAGEANRSDIEQVFRVYDTPTRRDKKHRTVGLPKSVTAKVAERFNRLFGRG